MHLSNAPSVLVLTGDEDPMWSFLLKACSEAEKQLIQLFPTNRPDIARVSFNPYNGKVKFIIRDKVIDGQSIKSVWLRRLIPPEISGFSRDLKDYCNKEYIEFYSGLEYLLPKVLWISRPSSIVKAGNKALQLVIARKLGFKTLDTIFTNDPNELEAFYKPNKSVYKSIKSAGIPISRTNYSSVFTTLITNKHLKKKAGIMSCPGIIQDFCDKKSDIRVTVFGNNVFAVEIESQKNKLSRVDFRIGAKHLKHKKHDLPDEIKNKCIKLVTECGLKFGAIDLALTKDDSYIFFEINPNGQWGWLEEKTGLPMRRALIDLLFQKDKQI